MSGISARIQYPYPIPERGIKDGAVTVNKIGIGAVNSTKIAGGAANRAKLAAGLAGSDVIDSGSESNVATLDITDLVGAYRAYVLIFDELTPVTNASNFLMRTSADNGSTFESGASDYEDASMHSVAGTVGGNGSTGRSSIALAFGFSASRAASGEIIIYNPTEAAYRTEVIGKFSYDDSNNSPKITHTMGNRAANEANDAIRFLFGSGNISTMNWTLYGLGLSLISP